MTRVQYIPVVCLACLVLASVFIPQFSNRIEMGSAVSGSRINLQTSTADRFISAAGDDPVEMNYDIKVAELAPLVPSEGYASAYIKGIIQESRDDSTDLFERITFSDMTSVHGSITSFQKNMHYSSRMFSFAL